MLIERLLAKRLQAGDAGAWDRVVRQEYPRILRFLRHLSGSAADAEDLAQGTFVKAREAALKFRHECSLRTWLHKIAYREFTHWLRDRRETPELLPERAAPEGRSDDAVVLAAAIAELPPDVRDAFLLREVQELTVREAAAVLGVPEGTVKSRNHTARERLRAMLAGTWEVVDGNESIGGQREPI
ncbi:RNA polymerase sigma factor [Fimbriimonas ginsengisoli]|uniref:RNA polymerase sigma-70 factor, ECF subfamily n=1 Tax=Fimbriimonas ginsengisoli Gsoil 348 TaxID=661478 RepID=A0A068NRA0_FIMGI|nr:RNA polymerase sigma factor [Fimbriimonas ginsengisoli]AIE85966.1 RNA polymerase sigma-70 factor, ECF subfamily [Fimbriimonas ginsengisoli Gsoil 348]